MYLNSVGLNIPAAGRSMSSLVSCSDCYNFNCGGDDGNWN